MEIINRTNLLIETKIQQAVSGFCTDGLIAEFKYCQSGTSLRTPATGTYYRRTKTRPQGRLIRVRLNKENRYPIKMNFKTSSYYRVKNSRGEEFIYQKMKPILLHNAEDLVLAIFLHEFSHYLDHIEGRNGRYKQTKADNFALSSLESLGVRIS